VIGPIIGSGSTRKSAATSRKKHITTLNTFKIVPVSMSHFTARHISPNISRLCEIHSRTTNPLFNISIRVLNVRIDFCSRLLAHQYSNFFICHKSRRFVNHHILQIHYIGPIIGSGSNRQGATNIWIAHESFFKESISSRHFTARIKAKTMCRRIDKCFITRARQFCACLWYRRVVHHTGTLDVRKVTT